MPHTRFLFRVHQDALDHIRLHETAPMPLIIRLMQGFQAIERTISDLTRENALLRSGAVVALPAPIRRGRGRPRKLAQSA